MGGKRFGYARVSTVAQEEARQIDLLKGKYNILDSDIYTDKLTGKTLKREKFQLLQQVLRSGDQVVVESLSRLSRSTKDLLALLGDWDERGITCISDKESIDFSTATGRLMLTVIAALAEFERETIRERVLEGLASARARGRTGGRPPTPKSKIEKAIKLYHAETHTISEIAEVTGVKRSVLYRALRKEKEQSLAAKNKDN